MSGVKITELIGPMPYRALRNTPARNRTAKEYREMRRTRGHAYARFIRRLEKVLTARLEEEFWGPLLYGDGTFEDDPL